MPRLARERSNSGIYHVMVRGINRQNLFEDDEDRQRLIETIGFYKSISNYDIYGYCLMNNHFHLLIKETGETISQAIKRISSSYVHWYNQKNKRCGHLFQERFKSEVVETDAYFLTVLRYIHQNPMKVGLITEIGDYRWSSYPEYIASPTVTDTEFGLGIFANDRNKALPLFIAYMGEMTTDECLDDFEKVSIADDEITVYLHSIGIESISAFQRYNKDERDQVLRKLKAIQGVTVRQLARVTGVSKSVIDRIR
ncbi:hypothetical protein SDC9_161076 [bioreactor metagenome]|uniref:Transposase IS200-like domain-containing protein n=1 Tax=bioreactor metagenome TaxID=1076179 RepID=A0A645FHA6_9ZZZZ